MSHVRDVLSFSVLARDLAPTTPNPVYCNLHEAPSITKQKIFRPRSAAVSFNQRSKQSKVTPEGKQDTYEIFSTVVLQVRASAMLTIPSSPTSLQPMLLIKKKKIYEKIIDQ